MKRFVGIDVANSGDHGLIEQERLQRRSPPPEPLVELFRVEGRIDWLRTQLGQRARGEELFLGAEQKAPEPSWIPIAELAPVVEVEHDVRVVGDLGGGIDKP
jgi:hypothetical protein